MYINVEIADGFNHIESLHLIKLIIGSSSQAKGSKFTSFDTYV